MKYNSITTDNVEHDAANMLAEFIWLNRDIRADMYPWRGNNGKDWGRIVAALKKLMKEPYSLSAEQLAFYIWQCKPKYIDPSQFAKMAVVARKLFHRYDLEQVAILYTNRRKDMASSGLEKVGYKKEKPKTLFSLLMELERGETKEE